MLTGWAYVLTPVLTWTWTCTCTCACLFKGDLTMESLGEGDPGGVP